MKPKNIFNAGNIAVFLFVVFAVLLLIQIILKLTGHSPTETQIIYIFIGAIISYLLVMSYNLGQFVGEVRGFMTISKNSFRKMGRDVDCLMQASKK